MWDDGQQLALIAAAVGLTGEIDFAVIPSHLNSNANDSLNSYSLE